MSISTVVNNAMFKWFWMNYILVGCPWYAVPVSIITRLFSENFRISRYKYISADILQTEDIVRRWYFVSFAINGSRQ